MQIPIISNRGKKKPWSSIPRINWTHPLTFGLQVYGYDTGAGVCVDLVSGGLTAKISTSIIGMGVSAFGSGILYDVANGGVMFKLRGQQGVVGTNYSFSAGFFATAVTGAVSVIFGVADAGGVNTNWGLGHNGAATTLALFYGGNETTVAGLTNFLNKFSTITGVATGATSQVHYLNGVQAGTSAVTSSVSTTGQNVMFNNGSNNSVGFQAITGFIHYGAFWNRSLLPEEIVMLHNDPYSFLIYPEDEMFATLVGVAAVTTSEDRFHQPWSSVGRRYAIIAAG